MYFSSKLRKLCFMNAPSSSGSQKRALNEWPPSCYLLSSVFMFSFLETEKKLVKPRGI